MARLLVLACVLLAVAVCTTSAASIQSKKRFSWCDDDAPRDTKVFRKSVQHDRRVTPPFYVSEERTLPDVGEKRKIVCVLVYDETGENTGSNVERLEGGVGFSWVTLRFTSGTFHGYNYNVEIYFEPSS